MRSDLFLVPVDPKANKARRRRIKHGKAVFLGKAAVPLAGWLF
jgi:hypothetical protein